MKFFPAWYLLTLAVALPLRAVPLVNYNDSWHYWKGTANPQADWRTVADAGLVGWSSGPGWIGFGDGSGATAVGTALGDMLGNYSTVFLRKSFTVPAGVPSSDRVKLRVDYDDGFAAWIGNAFVDQDGTTVTAGSPNPPAFNTTVAALHECSFGNSSPQPVRITDLGAAGTVLPPGDYVLNVVLLNQAVGSSDAVIKVDLYTEPVVAGLSGSYASLTLTKAGSPYTVTGNVTVSGILTVEAGAEVRFNQGLSMTVSGRVVAEGTETDRILFTKSAAATSWNNFLCNGAGQDNRFVRCDFHFGGGSTTLLQGRSGTRLHVEECEFDFTNSQMIDMTSTSCVIRNCRFDNIVGNELLHFTTMPANGYALIEGCRFGKPTVPVEPVTTGYNDIVDFTGGNRPGPIVRFYNNIFLASVDDCFDMDATDAHIEGNIFINVKQDAQRDSSSSPITTGEGASRSELVICRNWFFDCEHTLLLKDYGSCTLENNTAAHMTFNPLAKYSGTGVIPPGIILFGEPWRAGRVPGVGVIYRGNIAADLDPIIQATPFPQLEIAPQPFFLTTQNLIHRGAAHPTWPGQGNLNTDPLFVGPTDVASVNWQNIRQNLALQMNSPARGAGPNGIDMGANVPQWASLSGAPVGISPIGTATLTVGGAGIWAYKWRIDGGPWSAEVALVPSAVAGGSSLTEDMYAIPAPIVISGLTDGSHTVEVLGKNSGGDWQPEMASTSRNWMVALDDDADGMPNAWELLHGLDPALAADAHRDGDGDGADNLNEFFAGTNPGDRLSVLRASAEVMPGGSVRISWDAVAGKSYRVEASASLQSASWEDVAIVPAQASSGSAHIDDPDSTVLPRRFYRLVTPCAALSGWGLGRARAHHLPPGHIPTIVPEDCVGEQSCSPVQVIFFEKCKDFWTKTINNVNIICSSNYKKVNRP